MRYHSIDTIIKENRQFASTNHIREIAAYFHSEKNKTDSTLCLIEKYDSTGRIIYKKDFHFYDVKSYEEYIYNYDSIGRLVMFKQQNTYQAPSYEIVTLKYNTENRVSEFHDMYNTFTYTYYSNGFIKTLNNVERIYDKDWKWLCSIENKDTVFSIHYDSNGCKIYSYEKSREYYTQVNNENCDPLEILYYHSENEYQKKTPTFKVNYKYQDGHISERIKSYSKGFFIYKLKISKDTKYKYNSDGLLITEIELKQFGKTPRITNYFYK